MIKILVVEDERAISDLIRMNLEDAGYACTCVYDGMAAADQIETQTFDLVLLDIMLPKVNGYELLEYIKPTGTPVIFLTAKAGLDDRVKGLNLGAEDYIVKPFEIVELIARVQVVLRRFHKDVTCVWRSCHQYGQSYSTAGWRASRVDTERVYAVGDICTQQKYYPVSG